MLTATIMLIGSLALLVGTGLQVASWSFQSGTSKKPVTARHILTWMFDSDAFRNDLPSDKHRDLRSRALRRTRTGWVWLFMGAWAAAIASAIELVRSV
jgi:hypothetical protein